MGLSFALPPALRFTGRSAAVLQGLPKMVHNEYTAMKKHCTILVSQLRICSGPSADLPGTAAPTADQVISRPQ